MSNMKTASEQIKEGQGAQQGNQSVPTRDKVELAFANPKEFTPQHGLEVTTTMSLCRLVNGLFKCLPDYEVCIILLDQARNLQCALYFHLSPTHTEQSSVLSSEQMA